MSHLEQGGPGVSQDGVSSGLTPRLARYAGRSSAARLAIGGLLVCSLLMAGGLAGGEWLRSHGQGMLGIAAMVGGILVGLIGLLMALLGVVSFRSELTLFRDGPLLPGVVVSSNPAVVVALANVGQAVPGAAYALAQITTRSIGNPEAGTRVACFTRTQAELEADRMRSIHLHLIDWGTGDPADLRRCLEKIGEEPFRRLEACIARGPVPSGDMEKILLDESFEPVGTHTNA